MKKLFYTMGLALAVWGGAAAESLDRELGALATTRSNLFNIATALQMWAHDNEGQFPPTLEPLESNYLRRIPQQMDGSHQCRLSDNWEGCWPNFSEPYSTAGVGRVCKNASSVAFGARLWGMPWGCAARASPLPAASGSTPT